MADPRSSPSTGGFEVRVTSDSHFSWIRTRLSVERTMMSWQRTATALIGFGFAIVQYLYHLEQAPGAREAYLPHSPQYLGLALIGCGIVALLISLWQYVWTVRYMWGEPFTPFAGRRRRHSPHLHWPLRLFCRAVPAHLAARPSN